VDSSDPTRPETHSSLRRELHSAANGAAKRHEFVPTTFYRDIPRRTSRCGQLRPEYDSRAHVDAAGRTNASHGFLAQSGYRPFYIETAPPGEQLRCHHEASPEIRAMQSAIRNRPDSHLTALGSKIKDVQRNHRRLERCTCPECSGGRGCTSAMPRRSRSCELNGNAAWRLRWISSDGGMYSSTSTPRTASGSATHLWQWDWLVLWMMHFARRQQHGKLSHR